MEDKINILYAEDNPYDIDLMKKFLTGAGGINVTVLNSGADVLNELNKNRYDLRLLDYKLPDISGFDILLKLRAENNNIPVIFLTGFGNQDFIVQVLKAGADEFIVKRGNYIEKVYESVSKILKVEPRIGALNKNNSRPLKVIYIEDDPRDADLLINYFEEHSRHILLLHVYNEIDALEKISGGEVCDLVLCDLKLQDTNAIEVMKLFSDKGVDLPFIVITGQGDENSAIEAIKQGAFDYLTKSDRMYSLLPYAIENAVHRYQNVLMTRKYNEELEMLNRNLENRVKEKTKELEELNERKDKFFTLLAHDIRSPFNTILGFLDILIADFNEISDEEKLQYLLDLQKASKNLYGLLINLLEWANAKSGLIAFKPENINVRELFDNVAELFDLSLREKNISFNIATDESMSAYADPDMVYTIIRNLVSNAIKYTDKGGIIELVSKKEGENVVITVSDSGIGMNQEEVNNLFKIEKFHSKKGTEGETGTGFGLLLVYELIRKNNGAIECISSPGKGTKFIVKLPAGKHGN
ncbi:response regulator [Melioribacter roseus]|nr:response regulator [Melioribacter roseus]